jgi:hypothetical protein
LSVIACLRKVVTVLKTIGVVGLAAILLASPALAQLKRGSGAPLNESETKAALLGIDMQGYSPTFNMEWRECIQPDGETLYETPDGVLKGRLLITPSGEACFSYEDNDYATISCFATYRAGKGLRFEGREDTLFVTTRIVTGIRSCEPRSLVS